MCPNTSPAGAEPHISPFNRQASYCSKVCLRISTREKMASGPLFSIAAPAS